MEVVEAGMKVVAGAELGIKGASTVVLLVVLRISPSI